MIVSFYEDNKRGIAKENNSVQNRRSKSTADYCFFNAADTNCKNGEECYEYVFIISAATSRLEMQRSIACFSM